MATVVSRMDLFPLIMIVPAVDDNLGRGRSGDDDDDGNNDEVGGGGEKKEINSECLPLQPST